MDPISIKGTGTTCYLTRNLEYSGSTQRKKDKRLEGLCNDGMLLSKELSKWSTDWGMRFIGWGSSGWQATTAVQYLSYAGKLFCGLFQTVVYSGITAILLFYVFWSTIEISVCLKIEPREVLFKFYTIALVPYVKYQSFVVKQRRLLTSILTFLQTVLGCNSL